MTEKRGRTGEKEKVTGKEKRRKEGRKKKERNEGGDKQCMMLEGSYFSALRYLINLIKYTVHLFRHGLIA